MTSTWSSPNRSPQKPYQKRRRTEHFTLSQKTIRLIQREREHSIVYLQPVRDFSQLCDGRLFVHKLLLIQVAKLRTIKSNSEVSTKHSLSILNRQRETLINGLKMRQNTITLLQHTVIYCGTVSICVFLLYQILQLSSQRQR